MPRPRRWDEAARDQEPAGDDVPPSDPKEIEGAAYIAQTDLTPAQQTQLEALAATLTREQALWVSGYFAGIGRLGSVKDVFMGPASAIPAANATITVTVLYGSETGNSATLAESLGTRLRRAGLDVRVSDMDSYKVRQLKDEKYLFVVTSTHGEGDPPQSALNFFEYVEGRKAPRLPGLQFAVLALGDSTYERYCEAGKRLDRRLEDLGATRLHPRADCDVDYDGPAAQWINDVERTLPQQSGTTDAGAPTASVITLPAPASAIFDKRNPFLATIIENIVLTGRGSSKETRHIELSLSGSGLVYQPGDALGFMPRNDPAAVEAILSRAGLDGDILVDVKTGADAKTGRAALRDALASHFEIVTATPRFLQTWAELSGATELRRLSAPENASERSRFLNDHHVIDILRAFPVAGVAASDIVAALRPLQPRLYSIASSPAVAPDEVHLTVSTVRYDLHGEPRAGVASGYLAASGQPDTTLPVYIQANPHFRLPNDDTAIVMIGAGTGIAPYRAFLQEREARGSAGRSWLFFGERNFRTDFLYQTEWQDHLQSGVLSRIDLAFSRDRAEKTYVQHRIREKARDLYAWLEGGAHLYVCGDAANLAPDIHAALLAVVQEQGHLGPEAAEDYLRGLQRDHRYQRDVY
jgi:sulfite reductase (NADPH) flavoprotein alpha-component